MGVINRIGRLVGGSIDNRVAVEADDGYWYSSTINTSGSAIYSGSSSNIIRNGFIRFTGLTMPALIKSAYLYLNVSYATGTPSGNRIYFNLSATPTSPTTAASADSKLVNRTKAYVACNPAETGLFSYDITTIIQELLTAYGAYTDGAMMAFLKGSGTYTNYFGVDSVDGSPSTAARLVVEW